MLLLCLLHGMSLFSSPPLSLPPPTPTHHLPLAQLHLVYPVCTVPTYPCGLLDCLCNAWWSAYRGAGRDRTPSRFGLAVLRRAGKQTDVGLSPLRVTSLFKYCGSWTQSYDFDPLSYPHTHTHPLPHTADERFK